MTTYTNADVLNQQAAVATARLAVAQANATFNAAQSQLQVIQATIAQQNAEAAAAVVAATN